MKFLRNAVPLLMIAAALVFSGCHWNDVSDSGGDDDGVKISSLSFAKSTLSMKVGSMDYITIKVNPSTSQRDCEFKWSYDSKIISCDTASNFGVTITALAEGQTSLRCSYGGYDATCIITVSGFEQGYEETTEPYIYSNTSIIQTSPGVTEKVFVSLYGGDASDIDGYTWTIDNSSVATIQPTGQYCLITAKDSGYARIKVTNSKASYPYYMGVYVFADVTNVPYITTSTNILTMNQGDGEQTISCSLVNGKEGSLDSAFKWEIVSKDSDEVPVGLSFNGNNAVVTPLKGGSCTLRITHPDAAYPLDILCRVITIVKNVYINPDRTMITLNGTDEQTVTCELENIDIGEYSVDEYSYSLDNLSAAEIVSSVGNQVVLRGLANGSAKLVISHPKAAYPREVLCIVTGQLKDAVDASCYITTSQNYIRTKVGADTTSVSVSLRGGDDGDEKGFVWSVKSSPSSGSGDVISLETTDGSAVHSRAAAMTYAYGTAYITPKSEGTAVITVSHPKIVYTTEILVKVLDKDAILEEPLYFTGNGLVRVLNGSETEYSVGLNGKNKSSSDEQNIKWSNDDTRLSVVANGTSATIKAPSYGTGQTISHITVSHSKAEQDKTVLVMTADDEKTLMSMKALYSDKLYYNFEAGKEAIVFCNAVGFDEYDEETDETKSYDFSMFTWTTSDPAVISVDKNSYNPLSCTIKGLKAGTCTLTGSIDGYSCDFKITVYPVGTVQTDPEVYLTTTQNVVSLKSAGKTAAVNVSAVNLSAGKYSSIKWQVENESVATVQANGTSATITAAGEGETVINISHSESQNTLKIYVRVGSEYVIPEAEPLVYISSQDVITMLRDDSAQKLQAVLANYSGADTNGFQFSIDKEDIAKISAQSANGTAYIKPVGSGQAEITISHTATELTKKILVVVGNSSEELAGYVYLTTSSNVVAVGEGNTKNVSVTVKNSDSVVLDGYSWTSSNPNVVDVTSSGATAVLHGNGIGTAMITVTSKYCQYSLQIIAQCVDPVAAAANPYIQLTSSVMNLNVGTTYTSITADLVGGKQSDFSDFVWSTNDSSICAVYGQNEVGKVRALKAGTTYITVSHPKAAYPAQILAVCDEVKESECSISVPSSIITMKPTDGAKTVTATLVNGSANDKYNFSWSLDVYDIIDFQYSANVCTITPKQTGSVTITIHHPKAAYDQQIIVNVQQYSEFSFPKESMTIEQGSVQFVNMEVPTTTVSTHIEYSVENSNICSIVGTKSVAQITAVGAGTTTVKARLIATSTGVEQASSEMMVYVKEKSVDAVYITASTTIYTVNKGKSQSLSATLTGTGVTNSDQYNLKWTTSDSDIVQVTGISSDGTVKGQSIYITALKSGEAVITCSHEKAASTLQFYVVVPGTAEKAVTFDKTYMTILKGSSGSQLKATIENAESSNDYNNLIWTCEGANGAEVARVMGNGQKVTIYPVSVGEATVMAQLPDSSSVAKCTVIVEAGKSLVFETNSRKVQPFHSKILRYTVSPADAILTWTMSQGVGEDYFEYRDLGCDAEGNGQVEISGIKEGSGTLACVTDGGAKAQCAVRVAWDYEFSVDTTRLSGSPDKSYSVKYHVSPADADIQFSGDDSLFSSSMKKDNDGNGEITIVPVKEGKCTIKITAVNHQAEDGKKEIGSADISVKFNYDRLTVKPKIISDVSFISNERAYYSSLRDSALIIGDGEAVTVTLPIEEKKADPVVSMSATLTNQELIFTDNKNGTFTLAHKNDCTESCYQILKGYAPTYNGSRSYPNGQPINLDDFEIRMKHDTTDRHPYMKSHGWMKYYLYNTRTGSEVWEVGTNYHELESCEHEYDISQRTADYNGWSFERDSSLDGECIPVDKFMKTAWYYVTRQNNCYEEDLGSSERVILNEGIDTKHISVQYLQYSRDTSLKSQIPAGTINVNISHGDNRTSINFIVYVETRNCLSTYR
ncbi:hypothetical protein [uncultured Treponema sp.]|uniref:Ig-like domain-containing protein n=1 Tax=uncultured Treponema sp. TaxID=162155 RepID=UPI002628C763|nr:hypothetical protein [uncultured Treponema sp.]